MRVQSPLHPRQSLAFLSPAREIAYGGAAGGGKSHWLRTMAEWGAMLAPGMKIFIFRQHFEDLLTNHVDSDNGFRQKLQPLVDAKKVDILQRIIRFDNGSIIYLCSCSLSKHLQKYMGAEMHMLLVDEASQFPERWLRLLRSRARISEQMKAKIPPQYRHKFPFVGYTFNPGGASHSYFRRAFAKAAPPCVPWQAPEEEGGALRCFVPARLKDNPSLDEKEYTATLQGLRDPELIGALLEGDMDALVGSFFTEFSEGKHVVADFMPPTHWFKFRTFDWGSADPAAVYWWCVSDGEEFEDDQGRTRWFPRGALIAYREWYICNPDKPAEGIGMRNEDMAQGIIARTHEQTSNLTITDSLPFQDRGMGSGKRYTVADVFFEQGCPLTRGNCARIHGWTQLNDRLIGIEIDKGVRVPMIYFVESCWAARDYLPAIMRDEKHREDAVSDGEATHSPDCIRLACTARPIVKSAMPVTRKQVIREAEKNPLTFAGARKRAKREKVSGRTRKR